MSYRQDWVKLIRTLAPKYGLDPAAVLAVASAEGLGGGVGDHGTSFGPFQLHRGGALPKGRDRAWAESPQGIAWALAQIGQVAKGQHGQQAVESIVRRFERPADPGGEITRALGQYGSFGGSAGAGPTPSSAPSSGGGDIRRMLAQQLASGGSPNFLQLALAKRRGEQAGAPAPSGGGFVDPATGKLIGLPNQGTHTLGNWESDNAIDVSLPEGTPIRAPFDGVVGAQYGSLGKGGRFAGLRVHVQGAGNEWYGAHLSRLVVKPGQRVRAGEIIGYSGSANGVSHLHEALRSGDPRTLAR